MDATPGQVVTYNDDHYHALMTELKTISTYDGVTDWDQRATSEVGRIVDLIQGISEQVNRLTQELEQEQRAHGEKSFFGKLSSGRKGEKEIKAQIERHQNYLTKLDGMAAEMQEAIDISPNSAEEQKELVKELRLRKKELQLERREVAANMKAVREEARQKSAVAGKFLGSYDAKSAAYQRRQIRYKREGALRPQEDARAAVERQLIEVERDILWAERFKKG